LYAEGKPYGYSGHYLTYKGGKKKLEKYNFTELEEITLVALHDKNDYDSNFIIYTFLSIDLEHYKKSLMNICIDDKIISLDQEKIENLVGSLQALSKAKYGYYYYRHLKNDPISYSTGMGATRHRCIDQEDERLCEKWNDASRMNRGSYVTGNLRDIYKLNFLSSEHLNWQISNNQTLHQWINSDPSYGKLTELNPGFWSWYVEEGLIARVRQALLPSGMIICV
jgi:hypothetical protein